MAQTKVIFFKESNGTVPFLEWLDDLPSKVQLKCLVKIERLQQEGHTLRRPEADHLRDKVYELRASHQISHYRILYFFHGGQIAIDSHGITKEDRVPPIGIARAIERRQNFEKDPKAHTFEE